MKFKSKKADGILNRIHVAEPKARDDKVRTAFIPEAALKKRMQKLQKKSEDDEDDEDEDEMEAEDDFGIVPHKMMNNEFYKNKDKKTERDLEVELDVDYAMDFNKRFDLKNEEEKYDVIPEHWHGHNIADYVDPDIMKKLEELEKEEELRDQSGFCDLESESEIENMKDIRSKASQIRIKKKWMKNDQRIDNTKNKPVMPRTTEAVKRSRSVSRLKKEFTDLGVDMTGTEEAKFSNTPNKRKTREKSRENAKKAKMDVEGGSAQKTRNRTMSRDKSGVRDPEQAKKIKKMDKKMQRQQFAVRGKAGESDRKITTKMPKHLFAGKRGSGKTDRR
jgi:nucleolar GTP-binding protein